LTIKSNCNQKAKKQNKTKTKKKQKQKQTKNSQKKPRKKPKLVLGKVLTFQIVNQKLQVDEGQTLYWQRVGQTMVD
jgi:hypothetical protein